MDGSTQWRQALHGNHDPMPEAQRRDRRRRGEGGASAGKLGLEQAAFIMHQTGDVSALQLLAADLGFSLLPMCAEPDKGVEGEQLDDVERLADLQRAIRRNAPQKVRAKLLGALIIDLMETETAVQHEGRKGECRS